MSVSGQRLTDNVASAKTDRLKCENYFKDGGNPMISFDPKSGVSRNVLLKYVKLTNAHRCSR